MRFESTTIEGAFLVERRPFIDERGCFARLYCPDEFAAAGLAFRPEQTSISRNSRRGTLRGLHFQAPPYEEAKLVHAVRGAAFDVVVDLRPDSATRGRWFGARLDADSGLGVYAPRGCAHGFLTLEDETDIVYHIDGRYVAAAASGVRWSDPTIGVAWPFEPIVISERDAALPLSVAG